MAIFFNTDKGYEQDHAMINECHNKILGMIENGKHNFNNAKHAKLERNTFQFLKKT